MDTWEPSRASNDSGEGFGSAYLSLIQPLGIGPGWADGLMWAVAPAAIGNVLGAFLLVALPFWYAGTRRAEHTPAAESAGRVDV